jgi:hypothetical protein
MRTVIAFTFVSLVPLVAGAQYIGNIPTDPVVVTASFAKHVAQCEAALPVFRGETAKFLHEVNRTAPGYLQPEGIDTWAADIVQQAAERPVTGVTEEKCRELVFPVAKQAIEDLPCHMKVTGVKCRATK